MKVWLDDLRPPPGDDWVWVRTVEDAKELLRKGGVTEASLDNDLGEGQPEGRRLVLWMCQHGIWPTERISVHSGDPVAMEYMLGMIERYSRYVRRHGMTRFDPTDEGD